MDGLSREINDFDLIIKNGTLVDGTGKKLHMTGDSDTPPYPTGLDALLDGWRLFQASQAIPEHPGEEFRTSYLKHEFFFEKLEEGDF